MALITCPECRGQVSDKAEYCPHCGFPIQQYMARARQLKQDRLTNASGGIIIPEGSYNQQHKQTSQPAPQHDRPAPEPTHDEPEIAPKPSRLKEAVMAFFMLVFIVAVVGYFVAPYFSDATRPDTQLVMPSDSTADPEWADAPDNSEADSRDAKADRPKERDSQTDTEAADAQPVRRDSVARTVEPSPRETTQPDRVHRETPAAEPKAPAASESDRQLTE